MFLERPSRKDIFFSVSIIIIMYFIYPEIKYKAVIYSEGMFSSLDNSVKWNAIFNTISGMFALFFAFLFEYEVFDVKDDGFWNKLKKRKYLVLFWSCVAILLMYQIFKYIKISEIKIDDLNTIKNMVNK